MQILICLVFKKVISQMTKPKNGNAIGQEFFFYSSCTNHSKGLIILTNPEILIDDIELFLKKERIMGIKSKLKGIEMTIWR